jgi:hypothetical protein
MVVVAMNSSYVRRAFVQEWTLTSVLYFVGLFVTRGTVRCRWIILAAFLLGFAQMFGGTLMRESDRFTYFNRLCGYPYIQVLYTHFFGNTQDMELNPASPGRTKTPAKSWWGIARWKPDQQKKSPAQASPF